MSFCRGVFKLLRPPETWGWGWGRGWLKAAWITYITSVLSPRTSAHFSLDLHEAFLGCNGTPLLLLGSGGHLIRLDMLFIWVEAPPQKGAYFGMQGKQLREGSGKNALIHQSNNSESDKDRKKHGRMNSLFCYPSIQTCICNCTKMQISKEKKW